jgi:hypothetical protein
MQDRFTDMAQLLLDLALLSLPDESVAAKSDHGDGGFTAHREFPVLEKVRLKPLKSRFSSRPFTPLTRGAEIAEKDWIDSLCGLCGSSDCKERARNAFHSLRLV